jgi:hypothetical protein
MLLNYRRKQMLDKVIDELIDCKDALRSTRDMLLRLHPEYKEWWYKNFGGILDEDNV